MRKYVEYNGVKYFLHSSQKYYYCSKSKDRYSRCLHRQIWFDHHGAIPKGYHVHHKDGDASNNDISNLRVIPGPEHTRLHSIEKRDKEPEFMQNLARIGREYAKHWHGTPEGVQWHREHAAKIGLGKLTFTSRPCLVCQTVYEPKNNRSKFCSNKCKTKWRWDSGLDNEIRKCPTCSTNYECNKYSRQTYCSRTCAPPPNPYGQKGKPGGA